MDLKKLKEASKQIPGKGGEVICDLVDYAVSLEDTLEKLTEAAQPFANIANLEKFSDNIVVQYSTGIQISLFVGAWKSILVAVEAAEKVHHLKQ